MATSTWKRPPRSRNAPIPLTPAPQFRLIWTAVVLSKNFLSGFGSLDFYDFVFQTSKPEHAVKLKWEFPVSNSERY